MTKRAERPIVLLEEIDNAIRDVVFENCIVMRILIIIEISNSLVIPRRCYGHSWYNDYNRNCEGKFGENTRG